MSQHIKNLQHYLSTHVADQNADDLSPLEMLYQFYLEFCVIDTEAIRSQFAVLDGVLKNCTLTEQDLVADTLCAICTEHEKLAFLEGIRIGAQLILEVPE